MNYSFTMSTAQIGLPLMWSLRKNRTYPPGALEAPALQSYWNTE